MADLKESALFSSVEAQKKHWYYSHKTSFLRRLLECTLLARPGDSSKVAGAETGPLRCMDIGAGNGIISRSLGSAIGKKVVRWDLVDSAYPPNLLGQDPFDASITLYAAIPEGATYDMIIAIDVVEHIEDDAAFVKQLVRHLAPGGVMVVCVPAFQFLWSSHDVFLEHYRRYRRENLVRLLKQAGLLVVNSTYIYVILFPLIALIRILGRLGLRTGMSRPKQSSASSDLKVYPVPLNQILLGIMELELKLLKYMPWLGHSFGVSCVAVGRQPPDSAPSAITITSRRI